MRCKRSIGLLVLLLPLTATAQTESSLGATPGRTNSTKDETEVRNVYERWAKAFGAHDLRAVMAFYADQDTVIAYDVVPPLQFKSKAAYRKDYEDFLAQYDGPIAVEFRDLRVIAGSDVAFIHGLERFSGKLKSGEKSDLWLRATSGLRKINGKWLIVHDHVSAPVDLDSGKAALTLKP